MERPISDLVNWKQRQMIFYQNFNEWPNLANRNQAKTYLLSWCVLRPRAEVRSVHLWAETLGIELRFCRSFALKQTLIFKVKFDVFRCNYLEKVISFSQFKYGGEKFHCKQHSLIGLRNKFQQISKNSIFLTGYKFLGY